MVGIKIEPGESEDANIDSISGLVCVAHDAFSGGQSAPDPDYIKNRLRVMLRADTEVPFTPVIYGLNVEFVALESIQGALEGRLSRTRGRAETFIIESVFLNSSRD